MTPDEVRAHFLKLLHDDPSLSTGIGAIKTLLRILEDGKSETLQGINSQLKDATKAMLESDVNAKMSVRSGCELFQRFISLTALDDPDFTKVKADLVRRGHAYLENAASSRDKIAKLTAEFIQDGCTVLTHAYSRVVTNVLRAAAQSRRAQAQSSPFRVFVTESQPDRSGMRTVEELRKSGIEATLILDASVAYVLERCDFVLVGAESVVENGGLINKVGTFGVCVCAHSLNRPVYVCAESFKFVRLFPLSQTDLPELYRFPFSVYRESLKKNDALAEAHPLVDYTPPQYVTLLFTDLGILTPTAVSDELIKLYV